MSGLPAVAAGRPEPGPEVRAPYELFVALRYLRFHRGRTFLSIVSFISVAGVTVGTASLVIALALMAGFVEDVRARIRSGSAHLTVLSAGPDERFTGAGQLSAQAVAVDGVAVAAPIVYTPALVTNEDREAHGFVELHGIAPATHVQVIRGIDAPAIADDPFLRLESGAEGVRPIVLGRGLAGRIGAFEGDRVRVMVPRLTLTPWGGQPRSRVFEVVGTYRSEHFQEDSVRAYVSLDEARGLLREPDRSSRVEVRVDDLGQLAQVKERLAGALGPEWFVVDLIEQNRDLLRALRTERLILFLAIGLIVVVAALNIVSTLILMVTDKIKEIGTLTALGARRIGVARIFVLQGAIIGLCGSVAGLVLGWVACWVLDTYEIIKLNPEVYYLDHVPFTVQSVDLFFVGALTLATSLLATIYPAMKASGLDPVEAIRHE